MNKPLSNSLLFFKLIIIKILVSLISELLDVIKIFIKKKKKE